MNAKVIAVASDHAGFDLKEALKSELEADGYAVLDLGTHNGDSVDYPDFGIALANAIAEGKAGQGLLVCGTGIGISIAANRNPAVRAAVCHDVTTARLARQHNDANVLVLGSRIIGASVASETLRAFLCTEFEGGRHARRVEKLGL
ncbi:MULTISPECIES: ribose 5-phosphate isomerase B [Limibacillus]|jgi:ribose 5-phosphate isomerase B|uniref:Ribose 5-phosphate isomerase B n=1 Tax=Limibacillus halophilus TaxID=1579333 RepID=A0A839SVM6_9PROT|nr:ribose 5-phosphate isomerase B [Limibacillus halophilus]MBB3065730.1 ribose 5-phosphate isomerase B [Limibacillus halophilus]